MFSFSNINEKLKRNKFELKEENIWDVADGIGGAAVAAIDGIGGAAGAAVGAELETNLY
jgi:hypothetical protein